MDGLTQTTAALKIGYTRNGGHCRRLNVDEKTVAILAMAYADVVQIECDGKLPGALTLFCPGMNGRCRRMRAE